MNLISYQVPGFPKIAADDTVLTTTSTDGKNAPISIPVPKDTRVFIDVIGLHYNRKSSIISNPLFSRYSANPGYSEILGRSIRVSSGTFLGRL
jgi:hypothetical protein